MNNKILSPLKWRIDIDTYRKLGRELITDRITALYELVKNCYDANAQNVSINFKDVKSKDGKIVIEDDGIGMSFWDFQTKWMVISSGMKRIEKKSPPPFNRTYIGEKGIGRFAVDKIASKVIIKTKKKYSEHWLILEIDWSSYDKYITNNGVVEKEKLLEFEIERLLEERIFIISENKRHLYWVDEIDSKDTLLKKIKPLKLSVNHEEQLVRIWEKTRKIYLTDIEHKAAVKPGNREDHGTKLILNPLREIWTKNDIEIAYWELSKIVPPYTKMKRGFRINLRSNEHEEYKEKPVQNRAIEYSAVNFVLDSDKNYQEIIKYRNEKLLKEKVTTRKFGPIKFTLYYFDEKGKAHFRRFIKGYKIDGIRIYRDGLITTPFSEYEKNRDKQRDILGIDKRRWSGFWERVSSQDLIGIIEISNEKNPKIIDSSNRQDFIDCEEYRDLKSFIIEQLAELEKYLKYQKEAKKEKADKNLKSARKDLRDLNIFVSDLVKKAPDEIKPQLKKIKKVVTESNQKIKESEKRQATLEKELEQKENLYQSIISLQEFSKQVAHALNISIGKIKGMAEYMSDVMPIKYNEKKDLFVEYAKRIYSELQRTKKVLDFMLGFTKIHEKPNAFKLSDVISEIIDANEFNFERENIEIIEDIDPSVIIEANETAFKMIFENLVANSRKALRYEEGQGKIKITLYRNEENINIIFSDNGCGINPENKEKIYEVYFTTTAEEGGAGLGLYIVKNFLKTYKGVIELTDSEFKPHGATFKITIPLKKGE